MSGDYSRYRFDPRNAYAGVKMQQGRVQLDADWNEWTDAIERRSRAESVDTFGVFQVPGIGGVAVVSPQTPDAFLIEVSGGDITIGQGRMYVDGLLAENFGDEEGPQEFDPVLAELRGHDPIDYDQQSCHPVPVTLPDGGPHLAYLEVWQREVTRLQRPDLVEKAIGVDTTTRIQTVWQVRLLENIDASISCISPDADLGMVWDAIITPSAGRLSSRAVGVPPDEDPCELPPGGGYRGLENQLYRIEIHDGGTAGSATFKWSRDNASVASSVVEVVSDTELKLASLGRDAVLRFNTGDWVEIIDDWRELSGEAGDPTQRIGEMRKITVDDAKQTISFTPPLPANLIPTGVGTNTLKQRHLRVTRWDQKGEVRDDDNIIIIVDLDAPSSQGVIPVPAPGVWVTLEKGVQVQFSSDPAGGDFHCNDYWTVAARTADASVEILVDAPPQGIHRHYARLALVTFPNEETDCREHWPPDCGGGCCSVTVEPGGNIQEAIDSLAGEGGCVCLKSGIHEISAPLQIHASNIKLQGESLAAIVRATTALPYLLEIGSADIRVTEVEVSGIRFEATVTQDDGSILLYLHHCAEVRVEQCELEVIKQQFPTCIGLLMRDVRDVTVTGNRLRNLLHGIRVDDYLGRMMIEHNHIEGITLQISDADASFGQYGIQVDNKFVTPCHIEHNRIAHFWTAILLRGGARNSQVVNNQIRRIGESPEEPLPTNVNELRDYLDKRIYAIDIHTEHCCIEGNLINLSGSLWGGIRTNAEHTAITANTLRSSSKGSPSAPKPASIYCYRSADEGNTADHSSVSSNKVIGPQTGIIISRVDDVRIEDNFVDGMGSGWFIVRVDDCDASLVSGNRGRDVFFGIYHSSGEGNLVSDNQVSQCGMGISSLSENNLNVSNNMIADCLLTGIVLMIDDSATLSGNRVSNCGYSGFTGFTSLGIAVLAERIWIESDALVCIEGNEVLDTGVNPLTNIGTDQRAVGISVLCPSCQISHNRTGYTSNALNFELEHRALLLIGPVRYRSAFAARAQEIMFGSAVVTDNHFRGPGQSSLVEFLRWFINDNIDFRFEKITFSNNICDHLNGVPQDDDAATVRLWGGNLIAIGNHIKADDGVNAMSLGNRQQVALLGNITTGGYIHVGATTPAPLANFNIQT